jgi:purine nucleoside phosphorylase
MQQELEASYTCFPISGMSTVPEALTAHQVGMSVFAFSLITNECVLNEAAEEGPTEDEVIASGKEKKEDLKNIVAGMVTEIVRLDGSKKKDNVDGNDNNEEE